MYLSHTWLLTMPSLCSCWMWQIHLWQCGKEYPFESDLKRHKIKHHNKEIKTQVCMAAGCERSFMRKADLVSHTENHTGTVHYCDQCNYSATDICYLKQHKRKHSEELTIKCKVCGCGFRYYTQMKQHWDRDQQKCHKISSNIYSNLGLCMLEH